MKKTIKSLLAIAVAALTFHSCADVPAPYQIPSEGGNGGDDGVVKYLDETFETDFGDFTVKTIETDGFKWTINYKTATATGYDSSAKINKKSEGYLISPEIDLTNSTNAYLTFEYIFRYANNDGENKVYITDNYTGDPQTTAWEDITGTLIEGSDWNTFAKYAQNLPEKYIGKNGVRIAFYFNSSDKSSRTWEIKNVKVLEGKAEDSGQPTDEENLGTPEAPLTVAQALTIISGYKDKQQSTGDAYVKGKIAAISSTDPPGNSYGNATYEISDDGTTGTTLTVYRGYYGPNQKKFTSADDIKVGDEVVVVGKLYLFKNTMEFTQGNYIYMLNGNITTNDEPDQPDDPQPQPVDPTGENLLANGDFELWTGGLPDNWKSSTTASNATLSQSTDAHTGSYAVKIAHDASANKRMAYKEITLKAGTYLLTFYVKGSDGTTSVRPGYTNILENGKANSTYTYGDYVNDITTEWQLVNHTFTLANETKLNLVIMVPKNAASDPLIDDVTLTTSDGGLADGGQTEPVDPSVDPQPTSGFEAGKYFMVFKSGNTYKVAKPIDEASVKKGYGYIYMEDATLDNGVLSSSEANLFTFSAVTGGYAIQDSNNVYYYSKGTYKSFQLATTVPSDLGAWTVEINANGTASIKHSVTGFGLFHTVYQSKDELQPTTTGDNVYLVKQGERITF